MPLDGDGDGNGGGNYIGTFTVDIGEATADLDLVATSDTGVSQTDDLTNDDTPTFDVTVNRAGTIEIFDGPGIMPIATQPAAAGGSFSVTLPALAEGNHDIRARFRPALGNPVEDTRTILVDVTGPRLLTGTNLEQSPLSTRPVLFDEDVNADLVSLTNLQLIGPTGGLAIHSISGTGDSYEIAFDPIVVGGNYLLVATVAIEDLAGNRMDQDQDGIGGEVGQDEGLDLLTLIPDTTPPDVVLFDPIGSRNLPVSELNVTFSEALDEASLTLGDVTFNEAIRANTFSVGDVAISGPAGAVSVTGDDRHECVSRRDHRSVLVARKRRQRSTCFGT